MRVADDILDSVADLPMTGGAQLCRITSISLCINMFVRRRKLSRISREL